MLSQTLVSKPKKKFFLRDFSQLLLPFVCSNFTKLNQTYIKMVLFNSFRYERKNYIFLRRKETRHQMKVEKNQKKGQRRLEVAEE